MNSSKTLPIGNTRPPETSALLRRRRIVGQAEVAEDVAAPLVDVHFTHPGPFHHQVQWREVLLDQAQQFHWVILYRCFRFTEALEALQIRQQAHRHHLERLGLQVAEVEPVRPRRVEVGVELSDLRDGVYFIRHLIPALDEELERAHQLRQLPPHGQRVGAVVFEEALEHLKAAVVLLQDDAEVWLNLGMALEQSGVIAEAETAYHRVIALDPGGSLAGRAEQRLTRISSERFTGEDSGELREDAIAHLVDALKRFAGMTDEEVREIAFEIAILGSKRLSIRNREPVHTLRNLPGKFSGLELLCLEYAGFQRIDPSASQSSIN